MLTFSTVVHNKSGRLKGLELEIYIGGGISSKLLQGDKGCVGFEGDWVVDDLLSFAKCSRNLHQKTQSTIIYLKTFFTVTIYVLVYIP